MVPFTSLISMTSTVSSLNSLRRRILGSLCLISVFAFGAAHAHSTHTLDTANGKVEAPAHPERVVILDEAALDTALAVGVKPVGTVASRGSTGVANYVQDKAGDITIVGTAREFNLEAMLAQRPDIILAPPALPQDKYAMLSKLAPTIVPKGKTTDPWEERVRAYGDALGKRAEVDASLAAIGERVQKLKAEIEQKLPGKTVVSVVRWMPQGPMVMSNKVFAGQMLASLGLETTELAASIKDKPHSDILSLENLGAVDGDWLILATLNEDGRTTLEAARKQPAFTRLGAVSKGNVATVDGQVWSSGTGPIAAERLLADVETILLDK